MRLKRLKLAGFKSFARTTQFEFPDAVSAIVGPNGSGKSNVAEAIRWVLGEQSLKSLRGRRGEDLIFNGSPAVPRMGKAAAGLVFENRDRAIPLDFEEVILERKIFRDGTNEYHLNGSQVRLKDIVELLARMGLGETKHNIIGQGEVDRILSASPAERRGLLEEAIGLRLYQLRKREAERKLEETGENIAQVEAMAREIGPHVKFLKSQADKAERREAVRRELEDYYRAFVQKEAAAVAREADRLREEAAPADARLKVLEEEIVALTSEIDATSKERGDADPVKRTEQELQELENQRRELERQLGRIEGRMEARYPPPEEASRTIDLAAAEARLNPVMAELRQALALDDVAELKQRIRDAATALGEIIRQWKRSGREQAHGAHPPHDLERERTRLQEKLALLTRDLALLRQELDEKIQSVRLAQSGLRERFEQLRTLEEEAGDLRISRERLAFDQEKLALKRQELERVVAESGYSAAHLQEGEAPFAALELPDLKKKMEKLKIRLEEIGGIDPAIVKEYRDTKARHDFLERELSDLTAAGKDLRKLIAELEGRIERDFQKGFADIREEFHRYFRIIFGGGKGRILSVALRRGSNPEEGENGETGEAYRPEYGIDIDVDLPRKRIKGLAMLSGGERALVSIALLFAVTAVNPPPFLVLDETDAALDEANSQKYAAILKELSKKTQLVLVTHNRETMKQAGVLYGVTMGEDGVSKILSLKLEEAESYGNR